MFIKETGHKGTAAANKKGAHLQREVDVGEAATRRGKRCDGTGQGFQHDALVAPPTIPVRQVCTQTVCATVPYHITVHGAQDLCRVSCIIGGMRAHTMCAKQRWCTQSRIMSSTAEAVHFLQASHIPYVTYVTHDMSGSSAPCLGGSILMLGDGSTGSTDRRYIQAVQVQRKVHAGSTCETVDFECRRDAQGKLNWCSCMCCS